MGGVLTTGKSGTTGIVTGAKPSKSNDLSWLKERQLNLFCPGDGNEIAEGAMVDRS